ncbi:PadR family transcriptional regulator [Nocardia sp. SYP-A9097]|uniref:PadR family transcriptional regulator n=1 Tax=Nocardia sp. SYP-A9097 TaxID=2663237 RepID=UPI00129AEABE|nr:PadR family transcriptional regulator [Nocardia sp. SYP-A9097]MRH91700.1 PadR family transcriptional regulator [Nocardia sp. SYP-A9097]
MCSRFSHGRHSGYDLRWWMERQGRYVGSGVQLPQIYRRLSALVERGLVEFDIDPREGRPDAKVYRMTAAGHAELLAWARSPFKPAPRPMDRDFKLRFLFAGQLGRDIAIDILRTELAYRLEHDNLSPIATGQSFHDPQIPELNSDWASEVHLMAHEHGYASTAGHIAWLRITLARLEAEHPDRPPVRTTTAAATPTSNDSEEDETTHL